MRSKLACRHGAIAGGVLGIFLGVAAAPGAAQEGGPSKHFSVENPADLSDADAIDIYRRLKADLILGYRLSGKPIAEDYGRWRLYNSAPYRSAAHGKRFVNHYVNAMGRAYGRLEPGESLPAGSVIAKDSFAVTDAGDVFSGPLFVMQKMPAGFNTESRDWRYVMVMPDGSLFGATNGPDAANVQFCVTCHATAGDENDHLFFVPEAYRAEPAAAGD